MNGNSDETVMFAWGLPIVPSILSTDIPVLKTTTESALEGCGVPVRLVVKSTSIAPGWSY